MKKRIDFLGVPLDVMTMRDTIALIENSMRERRRLHHVALNVAKFVNMRNDLDLRGDVLEGDLIGIDGAGIVLGCWFLGHGRVERVAGIDLMDQILALCATSGFRPFVLGAKADILERAIARIKARHIGLEFAGYRNGYFTPSEEPEIIESIRMSRADCLFVAMPSPKKERLTRLYRDQIGVPFVMGVGGSIDVLAGTVKRAPLLIQRVGMEWAYRLAQEPRRLASRYIVTNAVYATILCTAVLRRANPFRRYGDTA